MSASEANVITGLGLVTPLGVGVDATWRALLDERFVVEGHAPVDRVGRISRVAQLGLIAAREALAYRDPKDIALLVGTSKGAADEWLADATKASGIASLADDLARELDIAGSPRFTFSAACASGLHAVARATMLLDRGDAKRCLIVASESSLHGIWHGTFNNLGVLARAGEPGRPFDADRNGFVISEAAAAIILERRTPEIGEIVVDDAQIAADATHITGGDAEGRSLTQLIRRLATDEVDFIHAHATGTASDAIESHAIRHAFPQRSPVTYSHKGSLGHSLGASGLVATVLSARIHATRRLPPMPTTRCPGDLDVTLAINGQRNIATRSSLVLAAGFGGALAGVRLMQKGGRPLA